LLQLKKVLKIVVILLLMVALLIVEVLLLMVAVPLMEAHRMVAVPLMEAHRKEIYSKVIVVKPGKITDSVFSRVTQYKKTSTTDLVWAAWFL
jgi:hypothetical protein